MTSGGPRPGNVWRDLAALAVDQVSTSLRDRFERGSVARSPDQPAPQSEPAPVARPGSLGSDLKDLVSAGLRTTTQSLQTFQEDRERRRAEAPMRRARMRATTRLAGAVGTGIMAVGLGTGAAVIAAADAQPAVEALPPAILAIGAGAGTAVLTRNGLRYRAEADRLERRLSASYAGPLDIDTPGRYGVPVAPEGSAAREPLRRLVAQQRSLAGLLPDLEPVAPELVELAAESEKSLYATAERVIRLERASQAAGDDEVITGPLGRLVVQLEEGVTAHQRLLEAAATVVVEITAAHDGTLTQHDVNEAADKLAALADGIREVRDVETGVMRDRVMPTSIAVPPPPAAPRARRPRSRRAQRH